MKNNKNKKGLPLHEKGTKLDLIELYFQVEKELEGPYSTTAEYRAGIAEVLVNDFQKYERALKIIQEDKYAGNKELANLAFDLALLGENAKAKELIELVENGFRIHDNSATYIYSPLAGACYLVGWKDKAKTYFKNAEIKINNESNYFQKYGILASAYVKIGDLENAEKIILQGPWMKMSNSISHYVSEFMLLLLKEKQYDFCFKLSNQVIKKDKSSEEGWLFKDGVNLLLKNKAFNETKEWISIFTEGEIEKETGCGIYGVGQLGLLMYENGMKEEASKYLIANIEKTNSVSSKAEYIQFLSKVNREEALRLLIDMPIEDKNGFLETYCYNLGKAYANLNELPTSIENALKKIEKPKHQFWFLFNLLQKPDPNNGKYQDLYNKLLEHFEEAGFKDSDSGQFENKVRVLLCLAELAKKMNKTSDFENRLKEANELTLSFSASDRKYNIKYLQNFYIKEGEIDKAFALLKKLTPVYRSLEAQYFAEEIANLGYWKACVETLNQVRSKDIKSLLKTCSKIINKKT